MCVCMWTDVFGCDCITHSFLVVLSIKLLIDMSLVTMALKWNLVLSSSSPWSWKMECRTNKWPTFTMHSQKLGKYWVVLSQLTCVEKYVQGRWRAQHRIIAPVKGTQVTFSRQGVIDGKMARLRVVQMAMGRTSVGMVHWLRDSSVNMAGILLTRRRGNG